MFRDAVRIETSSEGQRIYENTNGDDECQEHNQSFIGNRFGDVFLGQELFVDVGNNTTFRNGDFTK